MSLPIQSGRTLFHTSSLGLPSMCCLTRGSQGLTRHRIASAFLARPQLIQLSRSRLSSSSPLSSLAFQASPRLLATQSSPIARTPPSVPSTPSTARSPPSRPPPPAKPTTLIDGLSDEPLNLDEGTEQVNWAHSFHGLSAQPFSQEIAAILLAPIDPNDIEIKPDGIVYLPEIKYRRILNRAFGPGGWGMAPRGETIVTNKAVTREYALVAHGR